MHRRIGYWGIVPAVIGLVTLVFPGFASAASPDKQLVERQLEDLNLDQIEQFWHELMTRYGGFFPQGSTPSLMEIILPGGEGFSIGAVMQGILKFMFFEIAFNGKLLVSIVILTVFCMVLETLQNAFDKQAVSKVAYSISYLVLLIIAINSFHVAIGYAKESIESMIHFMLSSIPLLLALLTSMGNVVTVSVMHPLIVFMIHTVGTLIYTIVFPLLFFSAVLHIVSSLSDKYKVTQLANLLRTIGVALLGSFLAIFLGVISVQGAAGSVTDGVTIRTAKYITGTFVPVVGRLFTDATDTVISASLLVKNAIGLAGVIIILFLCAFPALKILALALIYNLSAAVMQPLGDSPIVACIRTIGRSLIYVFAALASVGLMFFLAVTIILAAGNATVMMR
jgi:stage III sporulation protein AE